MCLPKKLHLFFILLKFICHAYYRVTHWSYSAWPELGSHSALTSPLKKMDTGGKMDTNMDEKTKGTHVHTSLSEYKERATMSNNFLVSAWKSIVSSCPTPFSLSLMMLRPAVSTCKSSTSADALDENANDGPKLFLGNATRQWVVGDNKKTLDFPQKVFDMLPLRSHTNYKV